MKLISVTPKGPIVNVRAYKSELLKALDKTVIAIRHDFEYTTRTWETRVKFVERAARRVGARLEGLVGTDNTVYGYVARGTRPHLIRPRQAPFLRFQMGYRAKTSPGFIGSQAGGAFGPFVAAKQVHHPGTKARHFEETIAKKHQKLLEKAVRAAIQNAARKR